jgi:hypothetical protein
LGGARRPVRQSARDGEGSRLNRWRFLGAALAVASAAALGWLVGSHDFNLRPDRVEITGLRYTSAEDVRAVIGLPIGATPNVFRVQTGSMQRALEALPAVARAQVEAILPDRLLVTVTERTPAFVLRTATAAFLIDEGGVALYEPPAEDAAKLGLPVVDDSRALLATDFDVGGRLDEISLAADLRLAALTPANIGSSYATLALTVDDEEGYVLTAEPGGWRAIFGHYTPTLRPIDIIDRQVECLRARVDAGETEIAVIYLAPLEERCGTYMPRQTPRASASPSPAR